MIVRKPTLYLFPNLLGKHLYHEPWLPCSIDKAVLDIDGLIAESAQGGRSFLNRFRTKKKPSSLPLGIFNEHSREEDVDFLLEPLLSGEHWGFVSDCGLPCIADPGSSLVFRARQKGILVKAFSGPSSITLAIMLSGLPSQSFSFHGYVKRNVNERKRAILELERRSRADEATQVFIEAPYRSEKTIRNFVEILDESTRLCAAWDLTMPTQGIVCQDVSLWRKNPLPNLRKKPTVFLFKSGMRSKKAFP